VFGLTVAAAIAEGLGITLVLPLLKATDTSGQEVSGTVQKALYRGLEWIGISDSIVGILVFMGVVFLAKGLLKFAEKGYRGYLQTQLLRELKGGMFRNYGNMTHNYYVKNNTGHFINIINGQVNRFYLSFEHFVRFSSKTITSVSYFVIAFALAWKFALMAVTMGGVILFSFKYLNRYVRDLSVKSSSEMSTLNKLLVQSLRSFKYISSTGQVGRIEDGVFDSIRRLTGYKLRQKIASAFTSSIREPISIFFIIGVIIVQVVVFEGEIAPIFVAIILFHRGMQSTVDIQKRWQSTMDRIGALEMVVDEFDQVSSHQESGGDKRVEGLEEGIELNGVYYAYDQEDGDVLEDVSISIPANTTVALVGESGAGKSTLVDMLTLMLRPRRGSVFVDGVPGEEMDLASWRSHIGYVSQETVIFDDTVANNISLWAGDYATDPDVRARVQDAARQAYAHHFIEDLSNGYETMVGDEGVRLSGGQRQRLFIAREIFKRPDLLLLDEATSALDTESERYIQESVDGLKGEVTMVIIAHRLSTIKNVDYIYVLDEGRVIEEGTYEELRGRDSTRFREMIEMQSL
jgi:ABC-type multidrug transport system fused ATPase/permease subunit